MASLLSVDNFNTVPVVETAFTSVDNFNLSGPEVLQPGQVSPVIAEGFDGSVLITWGLAYRGLGHFSGYTITLTSADPDDSPVYLVGDIGTVVVGGLTNDVEYTVTIVARNEFGVSSTSSEPVLVTPTEVAGPPDDTVETVGPAPRSPNPPVLVVVTASDGMAQLEWTAPEFTGYAPLTGYRVTAVSEYTDDFGVLTVNLSVEDVTVVTIGHLLNDVEYTFTVKAVNSAGTSEASNSLTATPAAGLPNVPLPPDWIEPLPPDLRPPQPMIEAFPATFLFKPANWLATPEEAAANE